MAKKLAPITFDVHPGVAMVARWAAELPEKTGRSLDEWAELVRQRPTTDLKELRTWLKQEYGFGTNTAWWVAEYATGSPTWDGDPKLYLKNAADYVEAQFAGAKAWQRPIFETVVRHARSLGADVKVCPCKTIIPLYRNRVFAELKPATRTRLELAFALEDTPIEPPLEINPRAKGNDRLRHLVRLESADAFGPAVRRWLKLAYDKDG